jgi:sugar phosphate isomerase/epimerase
MMKIGLQLYSIKDESSKDFLAALFKVAQIGYTGVEFAGYFDVTAKQLAKALKDYGLAAAGTHVGYRILESELEQQIEFALGIGCEAILCPMIPRKMAGEERTFHEAAEKFNRYGRLCKEQGMRFLHHIHGNEFVNFGRKTGLDILLEETDPQFVAFEFDSYWIEKATSDSVGSYRGMGSRCPYIHLKDMNNRTEWIDTEVGAGMLDIPALLKEGKARNAEWYIVEQEKFDKEPMESVSISLHNLRRIEAIWRGKV